jgi:carbon starvation protein
MNAMWLVITALAVFALAYRFYFSFVAAKVAVVNDLRQAPAHRLFDNQNYYPMGKWVLFGHHFAAIAGAGPLVGPVLAAQFGYLPGFLWMIVGAVMAGAVHDLVILTASIRHDGKSLAEIARREIGKVSGATASVAILIIIVIALAGLGSVVTNALAQSPWGTFTIAATIPIAIFMGLWMFRFRKGRTAEATVIGIILLTAAVIYGRNIQNSSLASWFTFSRPTLALMLCAYGFCASALPVWLLLSPRDYLSSIMKLAVVAMLAGGVICVHPTLRMPATTDFIYGGGPLLKGSGTLFPYLFITIACGAVSGFHALVSSGTTPKMIMREAHIKAIAVGSMLAEGLVSVLALIAACSLAPADYFMINVQPPNVAHVLRTQMPDAGADREGAAKQLTDELAALRVRPADKDYGKFLATANQPAPKFVQAVHEMSQGPSNMRQLTDAVDERVVGRPGGAVSLAVGMAQIFSAIPGMKGLMSYWYHFAIMFEALFILTTIDAGTRIARFILQEALGKLHPQLARADWLPGNLLASLLIVGAWGYFLYTGGIDTIWPMFGAANQLLAGVALVIGTSFIINRGRARYAWVTLVPMAFVMATTLTAGWDNITGIYWPQILGDNPADRLQGVINLVLTALIMVSAIVILADALPKWFRAAKGKPIYTEPAIANSKAHAQPVLAEAGQP